VHALLPLISLYFPVAHAVHTPPFGPVHPVLHEQSLSCALAIFELDADGHCSHAVTAVAPMFVAYFPVSQSVHVAGPCAFLYVPALHSVQEPPFGPLAPALHVHAVTVVLAIPAFEFNGQASHVAAPSTAEYVLIPQALQAAFACSGLYSPGTHIMHLKFVFSSVNAYEPALHKQSLTTELPMGDVELIGHTEHAEAFVAPGVVEYLPISQSVHVAAPVCTLYVPATHSVHVPPSAPDDPVLQEQLCCAAEACSDQERAGHCMHVSCDVAASDCEYVFCSHDTQGDEPLTVLYFPAAHGTQVSESRVYPLSHRHAVVVLLPALDFEFRGHTSQSATESEPSAGKYVFTGQSVQL